MLALSRRRILARCCPALSDQFSGPLGLVRRRTSQDLDRPGVPVDPNPVSRPDRSRAVSGVDDAREAEFARDHGGMTQGPADVRRRARPRMVRW
jgi:hypothetical protein